MKRGRKSSYDNPYPVSLKCEKDLHDIMQYLGYEDPQVWAKGALTIAYERAGDLGADQLHKIIQVLRQEMKDTQERIAMFERVALDADIRQQAKKKKNIETRFDERGKAFQVVSVD